MPDHLNRKGPVRQIAYFTPDVRAGFSAGLYAQLKNGAPFAMMAFRNDGLRQDPWAFRGAL